MNLQHSLVFSIDHQTTFSLAAQQNSYPICKRIELSYPCEKDDVFKPYRDLKVSLSFDSDIVKPEEWNVSELLPGQSLNLQTRDLSASRKVLSELTEPQITEASLCATLPDGTVLAESKFKIDVLPANFWGGESRQPELLAAFVKPNGVYVENLVRQVTEILETNGFGRSADGYQSNTREKPYMVAAALWSVIYSQKLGYVTPPIGFATQGQRIRLAKEISNFKNTACLDTSLLFASCLECMGLNSVVAISKNHAFAGAWLVDQRSPLLTNDDPMDLRKRVDAKDLVLFETTLVTNVSPVTFSEACSVGREMVSEEHEDEFVYVIDIAQARSRQIRSLSTYEESLGEVEAEQKEAEISLPSTPILPPVGANNRVEDETPQTRIDMWQRRLLDLTKRNSLLNHSTRAVAIKLFCTDIGEMEDMLADGKSFKFQPAADSPINDNERDPLTFRLSTGNDLHKQYSVDQLKHNVLIANHTSSQLEKNTINLLRKAKNDLEEGGANTLFLSLGFLKWKETVDSDRCYRAPLILIPVELTRKSARAPIYMKQLQDEQPLFNLTLIEFLQNEHDINLNQFKDELPEDESGVDVELVWSTVRDAISEQSGFEVVEELVLGSFSFAKYLMWKDLKDRIDDLKENLFVKHMVDRPNDPYQQEASFVLQDDVDQKIDAAKIYTPLNCDSSQLVAVEASGRNQDFVLEGPPGTGKSETIANIIAHNIALGRKVLFVAEKMAALNVVYRRLQKIGLDHLCLELHSNKSNKKAVLEQLRAASTKRDVDGNNVWLEDVESLITVRQKLNEYVGELHSKSLYGVSIRDAIARSALYSKTHITELEWSKNLEEAPIKSAEELDEMLKTVQELALAYHDVEILDGASLESIKAKNWSYSWQTTVVDALKSFIDVHEDLTAVVRELLEVVGLEITQLDLKAMSSLKALVKLATMVIERPLSYAIGQGAKDSLMKLARLKDLKRSLDEKLVEIGHGSTYENVTRAPINSWVGNFKEFGEHWFKGWFTKRTINKEARIIGFSTFTDFNILSQLQSLQSLVVEIELLTKHFERDNIWTDWSTTADSLEESFLIGTEANDALSNAVKLTQDPSLVFLYIQKTYVDGRDFLEMSPIASLSRTYLAVNERFEQALDKLKSLEIFFDEKDSIDSIALSAQSIIALETKLKLWCEWQLSIAEAEKYNLKSIIRGLESGLILPDDAQAQALTAFCRWLVYPLLDKSDLLRQFKSSSHEHLIEEFRGIDAKVAKTTSDYIRAKASEITPDFESKDCPKEFGVLSREFQKKTRHKPVRALISDLGNSILDLCPCMMMSPMSVAQFLPADFNAFDLVVFDEASQMTVWDSVGAIARGKNVIVVGDPKQMPPTNFFNSTVESDDPDEDDLESILDQALSARLPHLRLVGHYRSRHETLIAFSNSKYYENSLLSYPSAETKESAVSLHRIDGVYAKGKGRNNPIEAKAVVDEVVRRLKDPVSNKHSIGIVTLNTDQQRTIEDLLDDARRSYPIIESYFHARDNYDSVFVKNLESVQGDERDVIILSLGYGPTEVYGKKMSMNFGPLNKAGGERRLNVAITRAKREVLVFSSFDSSMIDLSRTSSVAIEHLKHYLEFAEKGPIALSEQSTATYGVDQFDSDFEQAVAFALRDMGWRVQTQVGVSKFRIDLGVLHPDKPGVYLAGVECDGATYHGSPSARDRDRVRHIILEDLGWRLVRLWSTDYFIDPQGAMEKIHSRLNEILEEDRRRAEQQVNEEEFNVEVVHSSEKEYGEALSNEKDDSAVTQEGDDLIEPETSANEYDSSRYFESNYRGVLVDLVKQLLVSRKGIKVHTLALEVANLHGLSRTSKKQVELISEILQPWAGLKTFPNEEVVAWPSSEEVVDVIPWRGLEAFGYLRDWSEIPYPETIGLAQYAIKKSPDNPVNFICEELKIKRRHENTLDRFRSWVALASKSLSETSIFKEEST